MMPRSFPIDIAKAIQAVGVLHSAEGKGRVPFYRLLKFVYIADREYLKETGRPIVGGRNVAMKRGPLSSPLYDLIKGQHPDSREWSVFFTRIGRYLSMDTAPENDELSKREISKLQEVSERYRDLEEDEIGEITHEFEEYTRHYIANTSKEIPLESMLAALGLSQHAPQIARDIERVSEVGRLFKRP